jgi:hypothetical protein
VRPREALDPADAVRQGQGSKAAPHARHRGQDLHLRAGGRAPGDDVLQILQALLGLLQVGEQVVHLQAVDLRQHRPLQPGDGGHRGEGLEEKKDAGELLKQKGKEGVVTLVYAAHDEQHNGALVLKQLLERRKK